MATERYLNTAQATLAAEGRVQASVLLHTLMNDRRLVEARWAATGRPDPLKRLTGRSSLDRAIVSTKEIITRMDDLLAELHEASADNGTAAMDLPGSALVGAAMNGGARNGASHTATAQLDARP